MKRKIFIAALSASFVFLFTFCGNKNKSMDQEEAATNGLTAADTTAVLDKTSSFMQSLKEGKTDEALEMLYFVNDKSEVEKLNENQLADYQQHFQEFPVLSYKLEDLKFSGTEENLVKYMTEFYEKQPGDKMPNTIAVVFNPVKFEGEWYLTLKNKH